LAEIHPFYFTVYTKLTVRDKNGNVKHSTPEKEPLWHESYRYYRFSQISKDLFEAYRNLYLALESLLNYICPKQQENEREWLKNALSQVNLKVDLGKHLNGSCPIEEFIRTQYLGVRVKLFHAKSNIILPHDELSMRDVDEAYKQLILIWHDVALEYINAPGIQGGGLTEAGFRRMVSPFKNFQLVYTDDDKPFSRDDTEASPSGRIVYPFNYNEYLGEIGKFEIAYSGSINLNKDKITIPVYRICTMIEQKLAAVSFISDGLIVEDVDIFESIQHFRVISRVKNN